jgi:hypothetical protein
VKRVFAYSTIASLIWLCAASIAFAQHTEVQDAGSGRKTQTDYDATNKVTQQRTVDSEGNVLEKVEYEYLSGYAAPPPTVIRQTTTTYAPDGKIRETTRQTFDENTNFTEELIRVFDDAGKQIHGAAPMLAKTGTRPVKLTKESNVRKAKSHPAERKR